MSQQSHITGDWVCLKPNSWYFPGGPVIENLPSSTEQQVWSLVRELRSHMPRSSKPRLRDKPWEARAPNGEPAPGHWDPTPSTRAALGSAGEDYLQCGRPGCEPWAGISWRREGYPLQDSRLENPGTEQSMGPQRVRHNWATFTHSQINK